MRPPRKLSWFITPITIVYNWGGLTLYIFPPSQLRWSGRVRWGLWWLREYREPRSCHHSAIPHLIVWNLSKKGEDKLIERRWRSPHDHPHHQVAFPAPPPVEERQDPIRQGHCPLASALEDGWLGRFFSAATRTEGDYTLIWVKQCHKPPMTGNDYTTYINGDLGDGSWYCFTHISYIGYNTV